ncbi:MAG: glgB [Clostridia bacterium]|jgi:1,4-alpha-glucan branching enzyme|nr:glgB [Clostridia bacterium]
MMELGMNLRDKALQALEQGECKNIYQVLGMHALHEERGLGLKITVFAPTASSITAVHIGDPTKRYALKPRGEKGIFEGIIKRRKNKFLYQLQCEDAQGNSWIYTDPYQFDELFNKEDFELFNQGIDYKVYHKLGANFKAIKGIEGVVFAVWAPHAKRVSVVGEFNNWDGRRHPMGYIEGTGVWALFIPDIKALDAYKYEIKTREDILLYKADPYARYSQIRPNTASIVYNLNHYKWKDKNWLEKRKNKQYHKEPVSIYELHIGSWKRHTDGAFYTYREVAEHLAVYVKEMGYTHVELMGITEHPYDGSWGYQVTGYFAPTSRYGSPDDFRYLVDTMHKHHIGVILDWVPAHFPKDAFALEKFDGEPLYEYIDEKKAHHPQWGTLIFDYSKPQIKAFLIANALSWLTQYHIDGLRVDAVASMLYLDYGREGDHIVNEHGGRENLDAVVFLKELNQAAYREVPGIMMIAEESTSWSGVSHPIEAGGLGFGFKWNMGWMNDFLSYMKLDPYFRKHHHKKITFSLMYAFSENFIQVLSHDEVVHGKSSMIYKMPGNEWQKFANLRAAYGYMFMHPGKKMLFMGNEFAQTKEWNEDGELDWGLLAYKPHACIKAFVKELNTLYKNNKCLWEIGNGYENFEWIDCDNRDQSIVSFVRKGLSPKDKLVVIVNFTPVTWQDYRIGVPDKAVYTEVLNSDSQCYGGTGVVNDKVSAQENPWHNKPYSIEMSIPPLGICVFKIEKLLK